jgi:hypothetical protein
MISAAVEGLIDEAVVHRLVGHIGSTCTAVYGRQGKAWLRSKAGSYNSAAHHSPWFVLIDLDHDEPCAPQLVSAWIAQPAPHLCFRVAVREIEAWLLADDERLASFLGINRNRIPSNVEALSDPKQTMVQLAAASSRRAIRQDMTPRPNSGRSTGPAYTSRLIEFTQSSWRPAYAAKRAASLHRALVSLSRFTGAQ